MSVNPPYPLIYNLNENILLNIFTINSDMFADIDALHTTRRTSQVCHTWRQLMLATPSLWARLIDIDRISHALSDAWLSELIERSDDAPLWIKANDVHPVMNIPAIVDIISKNWHRIQKLVLLDEDPSFHFTPLALNIPAPQLEIFNVTISHDMLGNWEENKARLFGAHAPMLREFNLRNYVIDHREPWLSHLYSLTLGTYTVSDALRILSNARSIRELHITGIHNLIDPVISSRAIVSLPHLKSLHYNGDPQPCITLLDQLKIPLGCSLSIIIPPLSEGLDFETVSTLLTTFTHHVRNFLRSNVFDVVDIHYLPDCLISFEGRTTSPTETVYNLDIPLYHSDAPEHLFMMLQKLEILDFSRTTTLRFFTDKATFLPELGTFFLLFSSVDTVYVDSNSVDALMALENQMDSSGEPGVLFPVLRDLNFTIVYLDDGACQSAEQIYRAECFIRSRIKYGHPISWLNIEDTLHFDAHSNVDLLREIKDLEVTYTCSQAGQNSGM